MFYVILIFHLMYKMFLCNIDILLNIKKYVLSIINVLLSIKNLLTNPIRTLPFLLVTLPPPSQLFWLYKPRLVTIDIHWQVSLLFYHFILYINVLCYLKSDSVLFFFPFTRIHMII